MPNLTPYGYVPESRSAEEVESVAEGTIVPRPMNYSSLADGV